MTLSDSLNGWLQGAWPTLFAGSFVDDDNRIFVRTTTIYRKGSNNAVLHINEDDWIVHPYGLRLKVDGELSYRSPEWKICSPASPEFLDKLNDCLIRCCRGKDLR